MTQTKHTPGPWVVGSRHTENGVLTASGQLVANTHGSHRTYDREAQILEQDANARLIAAAPDMMDALRQWQSAELTNDEQELRNARNARDAIIAKAEGKS